jgi:hypothetical protein
MTDKKNILLAQGDVPLVRVDKLPFVWKHLIHDKSRDRFYSVTIYLEARGINTYLGGGVTEDYFFNGRVSTSDIDIIALRTNRGITDDLIAELYSASKTQTPFRMCEHHFYIREKTTEGLYMNAVNPNPKAVLPIFIAIAIPTLSETINKDRTYEGCLPFDITFMQKRDFLSSLRR